MADLVGQILRPGAADVLATLNCNCHQENAPILIKSVRDVVKCKRCARKFAIVAVAYDQRSGQALQVQIGVVLTPAEALAASGDD